MQFNINSTNIALAVSGGADSISMLYMLHEWAAKSQKQLTALTVNHNLRPEAIEECRYVAKCCHELGVPHTILEWDSAGITSNIHDQAREARYSLMTAWCKENVVDMLCTAHHMDDRVENFFIRISRGSGILGLIDRKEIIYNGVRVFRPLFDLQKTDLVEYLTQHKIKWFEDRSNSDTKYLRTNIRNWLARLPEEIDNDLFKHRVISVKDNLLRASKVIDRVFEEELASKVTFLEDRAVLTSMPQDEEIAYMLLSHIISTISGIEPPRLDSIELLYSKLLSGEPSKSTLGKCVIERKGSDVVFYKEVGRF